jgi:steroid delta-isomerase-like uncharacterized protein
MAADNTALARRWFEEVWNQRRTDTIDELVAPDGVSHTEMGPLRGPDEFKAKAHAPFLAAFPDLHITVEATVAQGDSVVVRWHATGTHGGDCFGCAPTGKPISIRGMTWIRYRDGKMVEGWDCWNQTGLIESLRSAATSLP